jgi:ABC-type multidrug transport system permease subunit
MRASVDSAALLELVWAAPLAAITVVTAWGLVVYGTSRAGEARRNGQTGVAALHVMVAAVGGTLFVAAIVLGLIVTAAKG